MKILAQAMTELYLQICIPHQNTISQLSVNSCVQNELVAEKEVPHFGSIFDAGEVKNIVMTLLKLFNLRTLYQSAILVDNIRNRDSLK
jgi:hypothetical protein